MMLVQSGLWLLLTSVVLSIVLGLDYSAQDGRCVSLETWLLLDLWKLELIFLVCLGSASMKRPLIELRTRLLDHVHPVVERLWPLSNPISLCRSQLFSYRRKTLQAVVHQLGWSRAH